VWIYRAVRALVVGMVVSIGTRRKSIERRGDATGRVKQTTRGHGVMKYGVK